MRDGDVPAPGGWNRIHLNVEDIGAEAAHFTATGDPFCNDVVRGPAGAQSLAIDPSGNLVELFQPTKR